MHLEPSFCTKKEIFGPILTNFCLEISFPDPKYDADWYETIVGRSGDTGNTFLAHLLDN